MSPQREAIRQGFSQIDLFAGAGGLSLGRSMGAGADVRVLWNVDPIACDTLRKNQRNHGGVILER